MKRTHGNSRLMRSSFVYGLKLDVENMTSLFVQKDTRYLLWFCYHSVTIFFCAYNFTSTLLTVWPDWAIFENYCQKIFYKSSPNILWMFGYFQTNIFLWKTGFGYFFVNFWKRFGHFSFQHLVTLIVDYLETRFKLEYVQLWASDVTTESTQTLLLMVLQCFR